MHLHSPASRADAIDLILSTAPPFDTDGARELFGRGSLDRTFDSGQRALDRVWQAREGDRPLGLVGGRTIGGLALVDLVALPVDDAAADALVAAATAWARTHPDAEAGFETPASDQPLDDPAARRIVDRFTAAGWRLLVTRRHYHLTPSDVAHAQPAPLPPTMRLERATATEEPRVRRLVARMLVDSLDVRDAAAVAEHGLAAAADELTDELLESDPIDSIRFAVDGEDAAFVSYRLLADGRGFVMQVGVAASHRGRGLSTQLVDVATRDLVAQGATMLIADTDDANVPMIRGFARAGWQATASRIDLVLD